MLQAQTILPSSPDMEQVKCLFLGAFLWVSFSCSVLDKRRLCVTSCPTLSLPTWP